MEGLGINLTYLLFQLGNFIVLLVALTWLLHKPLTKFLDLRKQEIEEGLSNAEKARKELEETERRQKEILDAAHSDASAILKQTKQQAIELQSRLQQEAEAQAHELMEQATLAIAAQKEQMHGELRNELADLVVKASEKVLDGHLADTEKKKEVERIVREMKA